ncbi:MAG: type II toxin-antitoxin system RelB/DinJ family antitoxin [Oscillibacter sp.]|nr:type II toxin-antitoxin system RelB/DinJ family antitoxin [Oscillibacter sp.]
MAQTNLNVPLDAGVKEQFGAICDELGMNEGTAVMIFIKAFIREDGFPFDVNLTSPYEETLAAVDDVNNGRNLLGPYHSIEELREAMNA